MFRTHRRDARGEKRRGTGERLLVAAAGDRDGAEAELVGKLHPEMAKPADPQDRDNVARHRPAVSERIESRNPGAQQGIAKSGNPRLRTTMIQLAWLWLRHQPDSLLSHWFQERVAGKGRRKLLIALWKYVTAGVVIERAVMKTA